MPVTSAVEQTFCRSAPWCGVARRVVLPWVLSDEQLSGLAAADLEVVSLRPAWVGQLMRFLARRT